VVRQSRATICLGDPAAMTRVRDTTLGRPQAPEQFELPGTRDPGFATPPREIGGLSFKQDKPAKYAKGPSQIEPRASALAPAPKGMPYAQGWSEAERLLGRR
jgi:hypothetical protein